MLNYVKPLPAYQWLDENYPGWSMEAHEQVDVMLDHVSVRVTLHLDEMVHRDVNGGEYAEVHSRSITRWGTEQIKKSKDTGEPIPNEYIKMAETDALKRCVMALGGFADIYMGAEPIEYTIGEDDMAWYTKTVLPYHAQNGTKPATIFKQMSMFALGKVTKEKIQETYGI
jgi:hypothetical protein